MTIKRKFYGAAYELYTILYEAIKFMYPRCGQSDQQAIEDHLKGRVQ